MVLITIRTLTKIKLKKPKIKSINKLSKNLNYIKEIDKNNINTILMLQFNWIKSFHNLYPS
jgi:hypothetical protein